MKKYLQNVHGVGLGLIGTKTNYLTDMHKNVLCIGDVVECSYLNRPPNLCVVVESQGYQYIYGYFGKTHTKEEFHNFKSQYKIKRVGRARSLKPTDTALGIFGFKIVEDKL